MKKILIGGALKAIVEIKGGFGNQIFQFAFAQHLRRLGYKVKVSLNHLNTNAHGIVKREIVINPQVYGFKEAHIIWIRLCRFLHKMSESRKASLIYINFIDPFFSKFSKLSSFEKSKPKSLSYFDGYWQDVKILDKEKKFIVESIEKVTQLEKCFEKKPKDGSTLVLVRRTDYISMHEDLSVSYFENALQFCRNNVINFNYEIFTDDIEWVKKQECFSDALKIHPPSNEPSQILKIFSEMINFENYIVGNSTFSLVAAVLSETKNSRIIVSDPWFRNSNKSMNYKKNWIKIKNQI